MLPSLPSYAELHCRSNFTFLHGASHPEELVERACDLGYSSLAITDECSLAGVVRAHVEAKKRGLHLIIGSEIKLACGTKLLFLARNKTGYGNLSELITLARRRAAKGSYTLYRSDLDAQADASAAHLMYLQDCLAILLPQRSASYDELSEQAAWLRQTFGTHAWIAVELLHWSGDEHWHAQLKELSAQQSLPLVAMGDVLMHVRSRKPLQDTLTAVRLGKSIAECGMDLQPNAEQHLRSRLRLSQVYPAALLEETLRLAELCTFSLEELRYQYPKAVSYTHLTLPTILLV